MLTVIEEVSVSEVIDREQELYPLLEDAFEALKWWLSRSPESGEIIDDINWLYKQAGNRPKNVPALVVIYNFDHEYVEIKFILVRVPTL